MFNAYKARYIHTLHIDTFTHIPQSILSTLDIIINRPAFPLKILAGEYSPTFLIRCAPKQSQFADYPIERWDILLKCLMRIEILMHNHAYLFDVTELVCYFSLIFSILGPIYMNLYRGGGLYPYPYIDF